MRLIRPDTILTVIIPMLEVGKGWVEFLTFVLPEAVVVVVDRVDVVEGFRFPRPTKMLEYHYVRLASGDIPAVEG